MFIFRAIIRNKKEKKKVHHNELLLCKFIQAEISQNQAKQDSILAFSHQGLNQTEN
jgi:hypothetical protein